jgi:hypothetical protein
MTQHWSLLTLFMWLCNLMVKCPAAIHVGECLFDSGPGLVEIFMPIFDAQNFSRFLEHLSWRKCRGRLSNSGWSSGNLVWSFCMWLYSSMVKSCQCKERLFDSSESLNLKFPYFFFFCSNPLFMHQLTKSMILYLFLTENIHTMIQITSRGITTGSVFIQTTPGAW